MDAFCYLAVGVKLNQAVVLLEMEICLQIRFPLGLRDEKLNFMFYLAS